MWRIWMVMDPRKVIIVGGIAVASIVATNHFVQLVSSFIDRTEFRHESSNFFSFLLYSLWKVSTDFCDFRFFDVW